MGKSIQPLRPHLTVRMQTPRAASEEKSLGGWGGGGGHVIGSSKSTKLERSRSQRSLKPRVQFVSRSTPVHVSTTMTLPMI